MFLVFNEKTRKQKLEAEGSQNPQRSDVRTNVLKAATLYYGDDGEHSVECVVTDISKQGARILVVLPELLPANFKLVFTQGQSGHLCALAWSSKDEIGVRFIDQ